jgi:4-amino-4-deoxy-L-arabinose transferase-like glycosyltransferase
VSRAKALVAGALFLGWFLAFTGARPLTVPDEGRYAEVAREMVVSGDWVTPRLDGVPFLDKPPLFYWMGALGFTAFGVRTWTARLAPALLGALGCLLVFLAGARLRGRRAGLLSAVVLAANPYYFGASQYVNHDLGVAVWICGAVLAFAVALPAGGPWRPAWLLAGCASAGLAVLTKGLVGVVFPFGVAGLWALATRRWVRASWQALVAGVALLAALVLPWALAAQAANPDFFHYFFVTQHFERFTGKGFNNPAGPAFYLVVLAAGLLPWTPLLPAAVRRAAGAFRRDRSDAGADLLLLLWPALVVVFFSIPRSKIAGYVAPALPPLALVLGIWWDQVLSRGGGRSLRVSSWLMVVLAVALVAAPVVPARLLPAAGAVKLAVTGVASLAAALVALAALRRRRMGLCFAGHAAFAVAFCAGVLLAVPDVVHDGTGPLAERMRPLLRSGDVVVSYRRYYYDLPLLLDRREPIVVADDWDDPAIPATDNWRRELWLGLRRQPEAAAWLVAPARLEVLCGGEARCFVVAPRRTLPELERLRLATIAEAGDQVLAASAAVLPHGPGGASRRGGGEAR